MKDYQFEPKSLNILALFTDSDSRYQVPPYQRHYRWEDEDVEKLWDNLLASWENNPKGSYFLGSIITSSPKKTIYVDVVDGQQRLTTLTILFCVLRDLHPDINKNSKDDLAISANNIREAIKSSDGKGRFILDRKFIPGDSSETDFNQNVIADAATKKIDREMMNTLKRKGEWDIKGDNPKYRFINSVVILRERLEELHNKKGKNGVAEFVNYLFRNVYIIRIDCKEVSFAITLFQVMNTTGMDLTSSDLIKSFLFRAIENKDEGLLKTNQRQFMHDWSNAEKIASACDTDIEDMLTLYLYYTCERTAKDSLFEDLERQFQEQINEGKKPTEIMGDILKFIKTYEREIVDAKDKVIFSLRYTPWENLWRSILLTALYENYSDFDKLAKELRRYYYLHWIAGKTLSHVKQTSFDVISRIKNGDPIKEIRETLRSQTVKHKKSEVLKEAIPNLLSNTVAEQQWAKPLLLLLEYDITDEGILSYIEWSNKLQVEHVLPQNPKSGWEHITKDVSDEFLNSAGNITLLLGKKNIEASNKPFAEKIGFYKGETGNSPGLTSFLITQKIIRAYDDGETEWTKATMEKRKKWFLEKIEKLLDIKKELADYKPDS